MVASIGWTPALIGKLRSLWDEGLSTAAIGVRMGISKNAVVGKAHRLNLPARPSPIRSRCDRPKRERVSRTAIRLTTYGPPRPPSPAPAPVSRSLPKVAPSSAHPISPPRGRLSLICATGCTPRHGETCCWPNGEPSRPGFAFCGDPAVRGRPYCEEHCGTAYVAKTDRRRAVTEDADVPA